MAANALNNQITAIFQLECKHRSKYNYGQTDTCHNIGAFINQALNANIALPNDTIQGYYKYIFKMGLY